MEDSAERQMSCSIAWFQDWSKNERISFGQVIIETEKNQGNLLKGVDKKTVRRPF